MRLSNVYIRNFRNFRDLNVSLSDHAVIVGENKIGKSNFLHALRLVLDPSLPDTARHLREEDFWDGLERPLSKEDNISISVDITEFEDVPRLLATLSDHLVSVEPMVARLTYVFQPLQDLERAPSKDSDFEFCMFGGDRPENVISSELRRRIPLDVFSALRDAEGDLANWRRSPLRPLLAKAASTVNEETLADIAGKASIAADAITAVPEIAALNKLVTGRLTQMVGDAHGAELTLGLTPTDHAGLLRSLRLFIDGGKRGIADASLGSANLIYLALKALELQQLVDEGNRDHTFLAIEEPEAHLHPHLQRLVYRDFLRPRTVVEADNAAAKSQPLEQNKTVLLTTHSAHIVSVTPVKSLVLLRQSDDARSTEAFSTAGIALDANDVADLERYLDVTRGEIVFSRAVLLVEGDAECFVVPVLAKLIGNDLDELGITVCSVSGTNFAPYVKFLGASGLNIPHAVVTDYDPVEGGGGLGLDRVTRLLEQIIGKKPETNSEPELRTLAKAHGLFLNDYTLEVDLFRAGRRNSICATLAELTTNSAATQRATDWKAKPETLDPKQLLKDIEAISKGRFAQRLASRLKNNICPQYLRDAIEYVATRCS